MRAIYKIRRERKKMFDNSETIAQRVKSLRNHYNMTQDEFAAELGILQSTLSAIECGNVKPKFETLQRLGNLIDHDNLEWLLYGNTEDINTSKWDRKRFEALLDRLSEDELKFCRQWLELYVNSLKKDKK
ncbi:helix-turn-helix domain-containing protein [Megamonas hypermegale]|uniref:helix-turn-helix domain-containing protein n=1 Tax=Megamonas hypermegale TaxID=158847 RepID=UPI0026EA17A5|nr:helix-turn-helix transcriptional regulator [Megamonas hypermegale]